MIVIAGIGRKDAPQVIENEATNNQRRMTDDRRTPFRKSAACTFPSAFLLKAASLLNFLLSLTMLTITHTEKKKKNYPYKYVSHKRILFFCNQQEMLSNVGHSLPYRLELTDEKMRPRVLYPKKISKMSRNK